jgi:hypothetical protein
MKPIVVTIGILVVIVAGFFAINSFIYKEKQGDGPGVVMPYQATLTGVETCLPHKDTSGPQTLECALGIKTDSGEYYALDLNDAPEAQAIIAGGKRFVASGTITPVEMLSSNNWQKYDVEGILSVTEGSVELEPGPTRPTPGTGIVTPDPKPQGSCFVGGCSGQICTDNPNIASTCEWREEYACYRTAKCERQASGQCGWTDTKELRACLIN